jgi:hypothetical protein
MNRWIKLAAILAVAAIVAGLSGGAGAADAPAGGASGKPAASRQAVLLRHTDLQTVAGAKRYLRAIGVNPSGLVIQRAAHNYAGPNCPGAGWACTSTAHPVVQVASAGGKNTFLCKTSRCAVVQTTVGVGATTSRSLAAAAAAMSMATCIKTTGLGQSCTINQPSATGTNKAVVFQDAGKKTGLTQTALYTASITQGPSSVTPQALTSVTAVNLACVHQSIFIDGSSNNTKSTNISVALEAHQSISITQNSGTGSNTAENTTSTNGVYDCGSAALTQDQQLTSTATSTVPSQITQNQNAANSGANVSLDVEQNQGSGFFGNATGQNSAIFEQSNSVTAVAVAPLGSSVSQTQSSTTGGINAVLNQDSRQMSTADATQTETQCEDAHLSGPATCDHATTDPPAYTLTQTQIGPIRKGSSTSSQTGNDADLFTIHQNSTQDTDKKSGQSNTLEVQCQTAGICTETQKISVDGTTTTTTQSGKNVSSTTTCSGSTCTTGSPTPTITFDGSPGTNSPPSTLGPYVMTAFGTDSQPVCPNAGSVVSSVNGPNGTLSFTPSLSHDLVGRCWATWSNGYAGDVYDNFNAGAPQLTQITMALPPSTNAFYFYAEPNAFDIFNVTATAQDGTTSGPIPVQGQAGAQYFGFYGTGGATIASITVTIAAKTCDPSNPSCIPDPDGFAVGEFGISPTTGTQVIG